VLVGLDVSFYHYRTMEQRSDIDVIGSKAIVFRQQVSERGFDRWTSIGHRDLAVELDEQPLYFQQSRDFRICTIYYAPAIVRRVTPEQCVGVERAAMWYPEEIEGRLLDTFMGRPNAREVRARVRLSED